MENNIEKNKKKGSKKIWIPLVLIMLIFAGFFAVKNYYLERFLRDNLGIEFSQINTMPLRKSIVIKDFSYRDNSKQNGETIKIDTLKVSLDNFNLKTKTLNIGDLTIDNLRIIDSKGMNILSPQIKESEKQVGQDKQQEIKEEVQEMVKEEVTKLLSEELVKEEGTKLLSEELVKEEGTKLLSEELLKGSETSQTEEPKQEQRSSKNSLTALFNKVQSALEKKNIDISQYVDVSKLDTSLIDVTKLIDERWIQQQVDRMLADALRGEIKKYSGQGKAFLAITEKRIEREKANPDFWTVNIRNAGIITEVQGVKLGGNFENLTNRLSDNPPPVVFEVGDLRGRSTVKGELLLQTVSGKSNIEIKDFDYSQNQKIKNYIREGNIEVIDNTILNNGNFEQKGVINLTDMKLNTDFIVEEMARAQGVSRNDVKMKIIKFALGEVRNVAVEYTYNSESDKLELKTNVISEVRRILRENSDMILRQVN